MGGKTHLMNPSVVKNINQIWLPIHGICNWTTIEYGHGSILRYHNSYDWLIPVIDKITSLDVYQKYKDEMSNIVSDGGIHINTKYIQVTYDQVVDFVNWYYELPVVA